MLVDDEQLALDFLKRYIEKTPEFDIEIVGSYTNPILAKDAILEEEIDVLFLDINLPEITGIQLAEEILEEKPELIIVFVTAYNDYAVEAFELNAIDYLVKPVQLNRFKETLSRLTKKLEANSSQVQPQTKGDKLQVNVLGHLSFTLPNKKTKEIHFRTKKALELFLYLFHRRHELVNKHVLVEMLWNDLESSRAFAQLYTAIYHIRKSLAPYSEYFQIKSQTEGYILHTNKVQVDAEEWEAQLEQLPPLNENSIERYLKVMKLYKGSYLQQYNYWWAEADQFHLEQLWIKHAMKMAGFYNQLDNLEQAKRWYHSICQLQPLMEEAYFALMKIYAKEGKNALVHQQYQALKKVLEEELDVLPEEKIIDWYNKWSVKA